MTATHSLDDDVKELREDPRVVRTTQDHHTAILDEHSVTFQKTRPGSTALTPNSAR
jgi:hypothetical protein